LKFVYAYLLTAIVMIHRMFCLKDFLTFLFRTKWMKHVRQEDEEEEKKQSLTHYRMNTLYQSTCQDVSIEERNYSNPCSLFR
jgi:hypothetical protein